MEWSLFNCDTLQASVTGPFESCHHPPQEVISACMVGPLSLTPSPRCPDSCDVCHTRGCTSSASLWTCPAPPPVHISLMKWEGMLSHFSQEFWKRFEWTPSKVGVGRSFLWRAAGKLFRLCGHVVTVTHSQLPLPSAWAWGVLQGRTWGGGDLQLKLADLRSRHTLPYH